MIKIKKLARLNKMFLYQLSRNQTKMFTRVIIMKNLRDFQIDSILNAFYLKLFITINVIKFLNIDNKKNYVIHIKRLKQFDKSRRLIHKNTILLFN